MALQKCGLNINREQEEMQPHGTIAFPCAGYASRHGDRPGDQVPWHKHEEIELICVTQGRLDIRVPGRVCTLGQGELALINAGLLHFVGGAPSGELHSLVFSPLLITGRINSAFYEKYIGPLLGCAEFALWCTDDAASVDMFSQAFGALAEDAFAYEFTVREKLSAILLKCYLSMRKKISVENRSKGTDTLRIECMIEFIRTHFAESITLSNIARSADVSPRECQRCFERMIGESPIRYLLKYRLMQSASLLISLPTASVAQICASCGFDHPSYYSAQFGKYFGCTPGEYRKLTPSQT